jgi:hypothetical protein
MLLVDIWHSASVRQNFNLVGEIRAHDFMGHECSSKKEAKKHASFIAHRIGTERPSFAKPGNCIAVRDECGAKIFATPITSPSGMSD